MSWRPIGGPARSGECGIRGRSGPAGAVDQRFAPGGSACHGMVPPTSMVAVTTGGRVGWGTGASTSPGRAAAAVRGEQGAQAEQSRRPDIADAPYRSGNVLIHHTSPVIPGRDHGRARAATAGARAVRGCREPGQATGTIRGAQATDAQAVPDARGAAARRGRASLAATTGRFLASSIGTPIEPRNVNRHWDDLRVKAGLDWLRPHACGTDVRRSCWLRAYQRGRSGRCLTTARSRSR